MASKPKIKDTGRAKSAKIVDSPQMATLKKQIEKLKAEVEIFKNNFDRSKVPKNIIESQDLSAIIEESYMRTLDELKKLKEEKGVVLGSDAKALEAKLQKMTRELSDCDSKRKHVAEELHLARQRLAVLERENQTLQQANGSQTQSSKKEDEGQINELEITIETIRIERDTSRKELMAVREANTDLKKKYSLLMDKVDASSILKGQSYSYKDATTKVSGTNNAQKDSITDLNKKVETFEREMQQHKIHSKQLEVELEGLKSENSSTTYQKQQLQQKVTELTSKLELAMKQSSDKTDGRQELMKHMDTQAETIKNLQQEIDSKTKELDDLRKQIVARNDSLDSASQSLKQEQETKGELELLVNSLKKDASSLQTRIEQLEMQANNREDKSGSEDDSRLRSMIQTLNEEVQVLKKQKEEAKMEISQHKHDLHDAFVSIEKKEKEMKTMKKTHDELLDRKDKTINTLRRESSIVDPTGGKPTLEVQNLEKQVKTLKEENQALQTRVSQLSGAKLQESNSGITNLSDDNRPTKLAERFSELYDNEWTEAFEEQEEACGGENEAIQYLYKLLLDIYSFCQSLAWKHAEGLQKACTILSGQTSANSKLQEISVIQKRLLKDVLKSFANLQVNSVFQLFIEARKVDGSSNPQTLEYIQKSIEVCWYMALQDPPVIIDTKTKTSDSFDSEMFKVYTAKGKSIDFIVWPPLMLNKDGPLIAKGVAQGK